MSRRHTRGRPGKIDQLPKAIRDNVDELLNGSGKTQLEILEIINAALADLNLEVQVSKSSLNRYSTRLAAVGERLREASAAAEAMTDTLNTASSGKLSETITELLKKLALDLTLDQVTRGELASPTFLKEVSLAMQRVESAAGMSQKREQEIRKAARQEAVEEAVEKVEQEAQERGLSEDTINEFKSILGLKN